MHDIRDRTRHDIPRSQLGSRIEMRHKPFPIPVHEIRTRPSHGLRDQASSTTGNVEHCGMELHELHVSQFNARSPCQCHSVAAGPFGIG